MIDATSTDALVGLRMALTFSRGNQNKQEVVKQRCRHAGGAIPGQGRWCGDDEIEEDNGELGVCAVDEGLWCRAWLMSGMIRGLSWSCQSSKI